MRALYLLGSTMRKLALLLFCLAPSLVLAKGLDDIKFSALPGDRFEVRLTFDGVPPEPQGYTIERPARIVLDFPNVVSNLHQRRFPLSFENSSSAMLLTSDGRTRLILNLSELTTYNGRVEGNNYIVEVGGVQGGYVAQTSPVGTVASAVGSSEEQSQARGPERHRVTDIDFRRGDEGEGRVIINLSDDNVRADVRSTGEGVRLSLTNVFLPEALRRRLDVTDFATPVRTISASYDERGTVLNIAAHGEFDYMAYQADEQYVISVKPLTQREIEAREQEFVYTGDRLSLNFQDIEVRSVLQIIADFTDLNLVASDTVSGRITLRLDNVPWDQALDLVLKTRGLDKRLNGNVLMVAPAAEIAERERQELASRQQLEELAPLRTEYIRVRYANAREMFELFRGQRGEGSSNTSTSNRGGSQATGSVLSSRGQAIVDERTNSIILTDTAERIEAFKRLVEQIDIPIRQVMIEARIVIANTDFRREMGIRWGGVGYTTSGSSLIEFAGSTGGLDSSPASPAEWLSGRGGNLDLNENMMVDLGVNNASGSFAFSVLTDNAFIDLELSALENSGYAEIVSQPKVITGDKQRATIESGTEIPYQEASASGATTTSFKEAVLKLDVTPQITPDNRVIMNLIINQDSVGAIDTGSDIPTIDVTQLETQVLVADGQTVVLGGIFQVESLTAQDKVPFLGDIPFLGRLFKRDLRLEEKRELLIFITPKIMADSLTN